VVVKDDAGHKTIIRSDSSGEVTQVEVTESSSTGPVAAAREAVGRVSALGGESWRRAQRRSRPGAGIPGAGVRRDVAVVMVAAVVLVLVIGAVAVLSLRKPAGETATSGSGVQVLSSRYSASPAVANHSCSARSVLITWTLQGVRPGTLTTVKVTGTGPTQQFNAAVGADGKTVKVSMSFRTPSKWDAEVVAVSGKLVRAPASNPAGAITLAC
jgi:hypothetical protein